MDVADALWPPDRPLRAVLFDRDGTLVDDVPYNGDPQRVRLRPGVPEGVARLRQLGLKIGLVTNQSGIGRGHLTTADVHEVNARVAELIGGLDAISVCPHIPSDGCSCRKPAPGLVHAACGALGVSPDECVVVGDAPHDLEAASLAGAWALPARGDGELARAFWLVAQWA